MCGIAGELRLDAPPDREATERMSAALVHRGPDAEGLWAEGPVVLGHRRLSVLDLAGGAQPMGREGVVLVFNGEAYDFASLRRELELRGHLFSSRSDTEVVLAAYLEWGEDFVRHVHGMFALALWDGRTRRLVLARDRFGKKPLYLAVGRGGALGTRLPPEGNAVQSDRVVFGSELKAFAARGDVPRTLDPEALVQYLAAEAVPAPHSIWAAVAKLPAACLAVHDGRTLRLERYWRVPAPEARTARDLAGAAGHLLELLDAAVAKRLVADVPLGVFLSGGVDSTAVTALATRHTRPVRTFSIGFDEPTFDESAWAALAAGRLGTQHRSARLSGAACLEILPEAVHQLDEPLADPSYLPMVLLSRFARKQVTVALAGDGGDELFAGYDPFLAHRPAALLARAPKPVQAFLAGAAERLSPDATNMSLAFRLKQLFRGLSAPPALRHVAWIGAFVPEELRTLLRPELRPLARDAVVYEEALAEVERGRRDGLAEGSVDEALRFYLRRYLVDDILVKADRASMAASLEVRAPFLDTAVVEFAVRLPWTEKLGLLETKRVLKRALTGLVPEEVLRRKKKGFGIPVAQWIRGPLRPMYEDLFSPRSLEASGAFEPGPTRALLDRHLSGGADLRKPLWTIGMFLLWQRRWGAAA